jgi:hypothetical protein
VAHIVALVGECWRVNLKQLNSFISLVKQIFCKSPARRRRWLKHLKENDVEKPCLPPSPVIVRWNTWFKAAIYHVDHFKYYSSFISNERRNEDDTQALTSLQKLIDECSDLEDQVNSNLNHFLLCIIFFICQLSFVNDTCKSVFFTLLRMEEDNLIASNVYFQLLKIHNEFANNTNNKYKHVIDACKIKLEKYLFHNGMPSINLFKSLRILDPVFFKLHSIDFDEYTKDFPELRFCKQEMNDYKLICSELNEEVDIKAFWSINKTKLPQLYNLAKVFLHFPISTAAVERSFSKYNMMLSDERHRLKPESIKRLIFLYYNKNIGHLNQNELPDDEEDDGDILLICPEDAETADEEMILSDEE